MIFNINSSTLYYTGGRSVNISLPVEIHEGLTVLTGPNGSGKTTFARIIEKGRNFRTNNIQLPSGVNPSVKYLEFNDVHSWIGASVGYYQQRYEAGMNDEVPTVSDIMGERVESALFKDMSRRLHLEGVEKKKVNFLSSGELRKLLIINILHENPDLLILDNPYIGLDRESRTVLNDALKELKGHGVSLLMLISDEQEIPEFADNILYVFHGTISSYPSIVKTDSSADYVPFDFTEADEEGNDDILEMQGCEVKYGDVKILDSVDWKIKSGERWSLTGPNGSGKSTLLSLICADNPKCYSNNVSLFGRRRGTGESIWDIKRRIGYVSPEMQLHFHGSGTVDHIIASGLNDTVGLFVRPTEEQFERAHKWLKHFNIRHLADRSFPSLSSGERQLVLIARSLIKEPRLLILDEPMHGLDSDNRRLVEQTIAEFLESNPKSAFVMVTHNPEELPQAVTLHKKLERSK